MERCHGDIATLGVGHCFQRWYWPELVKFVVISETNLVLNSFDCKGVCRSQMKRNFFRKLEGPWDLDLAGHLTNGSLSNAFCASLLISPRSLGCLVCIRVQDAALSCTAAGTDAPWAHTRRVQSSLIFISGVVAYQFGGIACWENRDVTKLMYEVCCNGRPGKLTHLYVQRLALNAQRSLGHLPLAQKSKKPWAGLTGNGWDLGVEWDNSHVKIYWFLRAESEAYTS